MLSRTTSASSDSAPASVPETSPQRQYGLYDHHAYGSPLSGQSPSTGSASAPPPGGREDGPQRPSGDASEAGPCSRRLNSDSSPRTPSPVDRIDEHENASNASRATKKSPPGFKIVARAKNAKADSVNIDDFPNEVLIHILSHLPPPSLSAISLVSQRFHALVTTPHLWRAAFSRYFPGPSLLHNDRHEDGGDVDSTPSEKRFFTRLTALASWRSEYILRTKMLRALERGKPSLPVEVLPNGRSGLSVAQMTYNSNLFTTVNHIDAAWDSGPLGKRAPRFIHGADDEGAASISDPTKATPGSWGFGDRQAFQCFAEEYPGVREYGLGEGEVIGVPNAMDVSQKHGVVYAEGLPGGSVFFRSSEEKRGRFLLPLQVHSNLERGIPNLDASRDAPCCVWIAKSGALPSLSNGLVGVLSGSSCGLVTAYSLGTAGLRARRLERGEVTARWALCPGVPIITIKVDENYSPRRNLAKRIWAVALNALGEIFYIQDLPARPEVPQLVKFSEKKLDEFAWETGRTVHWSLAEQTLRKAQPDPHHLSPQDVTRFPRSSSVTMGLSADKLADETRQFQEQATKKPKYFREICQGWEMQRRLEVDFAGDDSLGAGENVVVFDLAPTDDHLTLVKRYTRAKATPSALSSGHGVKHSTRGFRDSEGDQIPAFGPPDIEDDQTSSKPDTWLVSNFCAGEKELTTTAIDTSNFALLTTAEDPLLAMSGSVSSSPLSTPSGDMPPLSSRSDMPGQRSRFMAAGTASGDILIWDMRAPVSSISALSNTIKPMACIHTPSPQVSCLGLTALYVVHGGNDGLVQFWDPLYSTKRPLRTLNSRFSSRARRRLVQAAAGPHGVGVNLFAAGAICLDPDPTTLRGIVSLGAHLRYWSFGVADADHYKRVKRRARRSQRGSNAGTDRFTATGRGVILEHIADEEAAFRQEEKEDRAARHRMQTRYGIGLLGQDATDEEMLAYATLLSQEAARHDASRQSQSQSASSRTPTEAASSPLAGRDYDSDMAEAIRLSLEESSNADASSPSVGPSGSYTKGSRTVSPSHERRTSEWSEDDEIEFAQQLSLAEQKSRAEAASSDAPSILPDGR